MEKKTRLFGEQVRCFPDVFGSFRKFVEIQSWKFFKILGVFSVLFIYLSIYLILAKCILRFSVHGELNQCKFHS